MRFTGFAAGRRNDNNRSTASILSPLLRENKGSLVKALLACQVLAEGKHLTVAKTKRPDGGDTTAADRSFPMH